MLADFYPPPQQLVANEVRSLAWLMDHPYITEHHPRFALDARTFHDRYQNLRGGFQFFSFLDVYHEQWQREQKRIRGVEQPNLRLLLAALIERPAANVYGNISYCLAVMRRSRRPSLLRKFHFDMVTSPEARRQPHPISHFQYCGTIVPLMGEIGPTAAQLNQLHPKLSEPRILTWPMSLALLLDMMLHEFPDDRSADFRRTPEWRGIIRNNETLLLQRFYSRCVAVIANHGNENRLLADEFYLE